MAMQNSSASTPANNSSSKKSLLALLLFILLGSFAAGAGYYYWQKQHYEPIFDGSIPSQRLLLPEFTLRTTNNQPFTKRDLINNEQWSLLFFGFTSCPDVCPNTLAELRDSQLSVNDEVRIIMISADPERDTPARLGSYLSYYQIDVTGLTGDKRQIDKLTSAIGVPIAKMPLPNNDYTVDHSASLWLLDPQGNVAAKLSYPHQAMELKKLVPELIDYLS